jgi:hypothetical protein
MAEIFKVPQHTGDRGRPKEIEVLGGNSEKAGTTEILGARTPGEPKILDRTTTKEEKK